MASSGFFVSYRPKKGGEVETLSIIFEVITQHGSSAIILAKDTVVRIMKKDLLNIKVFQQARGLQIFED